MKQLMLNDLLHLTPEQINNSKIGLNMKWAGKSHFSNWYESDEDNRDTNFNYTAYYGRESGVQRNYTKVGQWSFGFVRLQEDPNKWLFVSAGEITSIPSADKKGPCDHVELEQFQGLIGRLIIRIHKGNTYSRYIFDMNRFINEAEVVEILPNVYEPIKFEGFEKVHLSFKTLKYILEGHKYYDYRAALMGVKGIYCLTDSKEGKLYIGSASGSDGVLQRWSNYIDNKTGGNQALIELYNKEGDEYFEKYFEYTIIETFGKNIETSKIIERENYWKEVFKTKENGYNRN